MDLNERTFARIAGEWRDLRAATVARRTEVRAQRFDAALAEYRALVSAGRWISGPSDLLGVIGKARDELLNSRLLAWLMDPRAQHRLGDAFLRTLVAQVWPDMVVDSLDGVTIEVEVDRVVADDTGQSYQARADIVVRQRGVTLVVENKVDAVEGPAQCERLYRTWMYEPGEVRWLFLTPTGRPPTSVLSNDAALAWRTISYRDVTALLESIAESAPADSSLGRSTVLQYVATLKRSYSSGGRGARL